MDTTQIVITSVSHKLSTEANRESAQYEEHVGIRLASDVDHNFIETVVLKMEKA